MNKVLLVLCAAEASERVLGLAFEKAGRQGALVAMYFLESGLANEVFDTFTDIGFIGERPSADLSESLMREHRQRGYEELERIGARAAEAGVAFEPLLEQGDLKAVVLEAIAARGIGCAILVRKGRPFRLFSRSPADEVRKSAPCEVVVFTDE